PMQLGRGAPPFIDGVGREEIGRRGARGRQLGARLVLVQRAVTRVPAQYLQVSRHWSAAAHRWLRFGCNPCAFQRLDTREKFFSKIPNYAGANIAGPPRSVFGRDRKK